MIIPFLRSETNNERLQQRDHTSRVSTNMSFAFSLLKFLSDFPPHKQVCTPPLHGTPHSSTLCFVGDQRQGQGAQGGSTEISGPHAQWGSSRLAAVDVAPLPILAREPK